MVIIYLIFNYLVFMYLLVFIGVIVVCLFIYLFDLNLQSLLIVFIIHTLTAMHLTM